MTIEIRPDDALIVIDVQNDFCPGGALAVPDGDAVVPVINGLIGRFAHVILTQDWHPAGHRSFASTHPGRQPFESIAWSYGPQTLWPDHCIQGSTGAEFHPDLRVDTAELVIRKGFRGEIDSYSAFMENDKTSRTGLAGYLRERRLNRLFFCGLALDFCVGWSALDGRRESFPAYLIEDACRAIDLNGSRAGALEQLQAADVQVITAGQFV
ncbi:bifunctional nicotinamidase/pyrazinamidase [Ferrovibrio sp.]|uniref:bifunctional nicotinamidase/pyrazinamidase n=1 Tax=Ferrovibrio sp. TaxID=1917215 RepID=UPI00311E5543